MICYMHQQHMYHWNMSFHDISWPWITCKKKTSPQCPSPPRDPMVTLLLVNDWYYILSPTISSQIFYLNGQRLTLLNQGINKGCLAGEVIFAQTHTVLVQCLIFSLCPNSIKRELKLKIILIYPGLHAIISTWRGRVVSEFQEDQ